jgi:hypothetical protein
MNRTEESFPSSRKSKKEKPAEESGSIFASSSPSPYAEESMGNTTENNGSSGEWVNYSFFGNNFLVIFLVILLIFPAIGMLIMSFLGNTYK